MIQFAVNSFNFHLFDQKIQSNLVPLAPTRWRKPKREDLTTQEYFSDYKREQSDPNPQIQVYRGVGEEVPEARGSHASSLKGSILARLSLGSRDSSGNRRNLQVDTRSLLSNEEDLGNYSDEHETIELRM